METFSKEADMEKQKVGFKGWKAAPFVFATEAFQSMVYTTLALNLSTYAFTRLHYTYPEAASVLNNYSGTTTLLTIVGGGITDAYISQFTGILIGQILGTIGALILVLSSALPQLHPPSCPLFDPSCIQPTKSQKAIFFLGLYILAIGLAMIKPNGPTLGAVQFNEKDPREKKKLLSYFNWFFFSTCLGAFPAVTFISYAAEANVAWGFGISAILLAMSILVICSGAPYRVKPHEGSPLTGVLRVFVAAVRKRKCETPPVEMLYEIEYGQISQRLPHTNQFLFLDKAAIISDKPETNSPWRLCTVTKVEEAKALLRIIPIFGCTILISCILSQLQTFTLTQGNTLNRRITKHFQMPLASLAAFPFLMILVLIPVYDRVVVPFLRGITGKERGISHLQRLGVGLVICSLSMAVAAMVERKRLRVVVQQNQMDNPAAVLPMSIFWLVFQFLVFGLGEMFTVAGLLDFFYTESPEGMRGMGISLVNVSISFGYFLSSAIVSVVNKTTTPDWLPKNFNRGKLDHFYWLLAVLGGINFINYLFWSWWYKPRLQYTQVEMQVNDKSKDTTSFSGIYSTQSLA